MKAKKTVAHAIQDFIEIGSTTLSRVLYLILISLSGINSCLLKGKTKIWTCLFDFLF